MFQNNLSLASRIKNSLTTTGDKKITFLNRGEVKNNETLSGVDAHEKILKIANFIVGKMKVHKPVSSPVIVAMSSGLNTILTINSCIYAGVIFIPIQVSKREGSYIKAKKLFQNCGVKEVITDHFGKEFVDVLKKEYDLSQDVHCILIDDNELDKIYDASEELLLGFKKPLSEYCLIQHTSGSTSDPKAIVLTGQNILNNQVKIKKQWGLSNQSVFCSWLPHHHDMGLFSILYSILNSKHLIVTSPLAFVQKPIRWLKIITHYKVNITGGPPFAFRLCIEYFKKNSDMSIDLSSLTVLFCGAESVPKILFKDFYNTFKRFGFKSSALFNTYGMAEVVSYIAGSSKLEPHEDSFSESLYVAPVFLSKEAYPTVKIVNPETSNLVAEGIEGEIWVQNDSLAIGYLESLPDGTFSINRKGFDGKLPNKKGEWFKTQDIGIIKGENLYVLGRTTDIIINNGVNFSASEIELIASRVHATLNPFGAAVFQKSVKDKILITLLIEFSESKITLESLEEIKNSIRRTILEYFSIHIDHIYLLKRGALPRTDSGKIKRSFIANSFNKMLYSNKILL
ncbi:AMP-binding protein [Winogradskyella sp.]|uniref:AMP-binding protein n=1 Tax=Winogradskyella sp. TaxID=1883156 RepID=UPI003AB364A9